jgi:hypothetical protein
MTFPGTRSAPRHMPPAPMGQLHDPGGRDSVERAFRRQQQVAQSYSTYRASIPDGVSPDELADNAGIFAVSDHALQLQPPLDDVGADVAAANQNVADLTAGPGVPEENTGQSQMIWARAKDRFDKAKSIAQKATIAQDLIATANGLTLATYQAELPFYLQTEGVPTDWLPAAFAARTPEAADAVATANRLQKSSAVLQANHQKLFRAFRQNTDVPPLLDPASVSDQPYVNPTGG